METTSVKRLAVLDFDHTVVDDNTDKVVRDLLKKEEIPPRVNELHKQDGWTAYMQEIFKLLYKKNVGSDAIRRAIQKIPVVDSMDVLIRDLVRAHGFDVIIISDSNSVFIDDWLTARDLKQYVHRVFTNPAYYENELLRIAMFHFQDSCKLSTKNLCKGKIMEDFLHYRKENGVTYSQIIYVGDGRNDVCPMLRLGVDDWACARKGYACADVLHEFADRNCDGGLKAKTCIWQSGSDILQLIK